MLAPRAGVMWFDPRCNLKYKSKFIKLNASINSTTNPLTDIEIDEAEVQKLLNNLKNGKAAGPDDILLSETAESLAIPVSIIFRNRK